MDTKNDYKKILLIDDDLTIIKLVEKRLQDKGYSVMASQDAAVGLDKAMKENPDLIVLDVMMPIINGYNFCRLLKNESHCKSIPVMFLTSRSGEKDKQIGQEVGADAYLTKPINIDELLDKVEELLRRG